MQPDPLLVVDYSFARPAPATIRAAGYSGVARYLAPLPNRKVLDRTELEQLQAEGLAVVVVWESTSNRAGQGYAAGRVDANEADRQANALGLPLDRPIYFAVDYDAAPSIIAPYLRGAGDGTNHPVGVYGSRRVVDFALDAGLVRFGWQTVAWSHGQLSARAHLYQRAAATVPSPIEGTDENVALQPDFGQWPAPDHQENDDMPPPSCVMLDGPDYQLLLVAPPFRWHIPDGDTRDVGTFMGWWQRPPDKPSPPNVQAAALKLIDAGTFDPGGR